MNLLEGLRVALLEIKAHKLRSFLTLFGVAIGITSVLSMTGIMSGLQMEMRNGIKRAGEGRIMIWQRGTDDTTFRSSGLRYEDALSIRRNFPDLRAVSPWADAELNVFFSDFNAKVHVNGVTPDWTKFDWNYTLRGRFISERDLKNYANICVLIRKRNDKSEFWRESDPLDPLFKQYDPLHKTIRINQTDFLVVGILQEGPRDHMFNVENGDKNILIPLTSFQKRLAYKDETIEQIDLDTANTATSYAMGKRVFGLLKRRHRGVEDFGVHNMADMTGAAMNWANMADAVMGAIAAIALFAGGVGIMNITLASVHARIKEIGIRKSVGARAKDIQMQFLIEAAALSLIGGTLGVILGFMVCILVKRFAHMGLLPSVIPVLASFLISVGVGVVFSWYPAKQASKLDPIEALRYE